MLSPTAKILIAARVSPPPAIVKALLLAIAWLKARVPSAKGGNSNIPTGPFQIRVLTFSITLANFSRVFGPISRIKSFSPTSFTDLISIVASAFISFATTTSTGSNTSPFWACNASLTASASETKFFSAKDAPIFFPSASKKVLAMPPPTIK